MKDKEKDKMQIKEVSRLLKRSERIFFVTGSGISADSGVPTYRGVGGLYNINKTVEGYPIQEVLSGDMVRENPQITWKYIGQIEQKCRGAKFNKAHQVIARMQDRFQKVLVLTQNIDGFHRKAGSKEVIDIHGNMYRLVCPNCDFLKEVTSYSRINIPPRCDSCKSILRPDVVFFGELLPQDKIIRLREEVDTGFDIYFSVGTMCTFPYIVQPLLEAKFKGIPIVEINPGQTNVSSFVDYKISLGASQALEEIERELNN